MAAAARVRMPRRPVRGFSFASSSRIRRASAPCSSPR